MRSAASTLSGESLSAYWRKIDYVAQTELSDIIISRGQESTAGDGLSYAILEKVYQEPDLHRLNRYIKEHVKCFSNADEWVGYLEARDFCLGTRLHGTIAALLAGTPALLVTHDMRTSEMADFAGMPQITGADLLARDDLSFQGLYDGLDFTGFNRRQKEYYDNFRAFFDENDVEHNLAPIDGGMLGGTEE